MCEPEMLKKLVLKMLFSFTGFNSKCFSYLCIFLMFSFYTVFFFLSLPCKPCQSLQVLLLGVVFCISFL